MVPVALQRFTKKKKQRMGLWAQINKEFRVCVREKVKAKKERATPAAVIYHRRSHKYLLITSINGGPSDPGLVKGGAKKGESARRALLREIGEELQVKRRQIKIRGYLGSYSVSSLKHKEGLKKKRYFIFLVSYDGPHELNTNGELLDYEWKEFNEVEGRISILKDTRQGKYDVLSGSFNALKHLHEHPTTNPRA